MPIYIQVTLAHNDQPIFVNASKILCYYPSKSIKDEKTDVTRIELEGEDNVMEVKETAEEINKKIENDKATIIVAFANSLGVTLN